MPTPRPGRPVRGSTTGQPIMALFDLLGRRWAMRILWELRESGASFRELRARCDNISPSVLNTRLAELREAEVVELLPDEGYSLTRTGRDLLGALTPLHDWSCRWARRQQRRS